MKFRTQSGDLVDIDPMSLNAPRPELADPSVAPGEGQLMPQLLRHRIEEIIREHGSDPSKAALELCVMLDGEFDLVENGRFEDDEEAIEAIIEARQADE